MSDQVVCGDKLPDFQGTAGFMFSYKGIELNATFRFQYGAQMYNQTLVDKVGKCFVERVMWINVCTMVVGVIPVT